MAAADAIASRGLSYEAALHELAHLLHQIAVAQQVPAAIADDLPMRENILAVAQSLSPEDAQLYYQIALHGRRDLPLAPDEYAGFSMTLLRMLAFAPADPAKVSLPGTTPVSRPAAAPEPQTAPSAMPKSPDVVNLAAVQPDIPAAPVAETTLPVVPAPQQEAAATIATPDANLPWQETNTSVPTFDGDWRGLVSQLKLGAAGMLAQHAELTSWDADSIQLRVAAEHRAVATRDYLDKLKDALSAYFNRSIRLNVEIADTVDHTPAAQAQRERDARQQVANESIQNDPFVQALVRDFGATVQPDSIKPL
jgi:DNA polymerase-3 subunit gamma/tau